MSDLCRGEQIFIRIQFFPDNYSIFYAELTGPAGTPLATTHELVKKMAVRIAESGDGQAESALGFAGYYINEDFSPQYGNNLGYVAVTLPSSAKDILRTFRKTMLSFILIAVRKMLEPLVPQGFALSVRPEKDGPPSGKDINIRVLGRDSDNVSALAKELEAFSSGRPADISLADRSDDDQGSEARVFRIKIDAERAAEWGLTVSPRSPALPLRHCRDRLWGR